MKKLSEYKDEEALDLLADLLDPITEMALDDKFQEAMAGNRIQFVKFAIKNHKESVMQILAVLSGVPREEFHCSVITLPMMFLELIKDRDLMSFFSLQGLEDSESASGSAMENTEGEG